MKSLSNCPVCESRQVVEGRIFSADPDNGIGEKFFPRGLRLLLWRRSVQLTGKQAFKACTQCGHVWNQVDVTALRELIERGASEDLRRRLRVEG